MNKEKNKQSVSKKYGIIAQQKIPAEGWSPEKQDWLIDDFLWRRPLNPVAEGFSLLPHGILQQLLTTVTS
jgi:hypothetical protein